MQLIPPVYVCSTGNDARIILWYVGRPIPNDDCPGKVSVGVPELRWLGPGPTSELSLHPILWSIDLEDAASISGVMRGDRVEICLIIFGTPTPFIGALPGFRCNCTSLPSQAFTCLMRTYIAFRFTATLVPRVGRCANEHLGTH